MESPVIGLGVELPEGLETVPGNHDEIESVRQRLRLPEFFLVYVGRLESGKGLSYLLPWMIGFNENREKQDEPIIPLVLIGDGQAA